MLSAHTHAPAAQTNRLADETSPYLLQHASNPVDWHPWGEQALTLARQQNKPILLSIGYSACHWCHVMAHESFEDPDVAAVMNRLFINIKVDREERPDIDQIYQSAHQMLAQRSGGWPLTVFLAPDGAPFYTGTYFPRESRYGLPGFADLCQRVADAFESKRTDIESQNAEVVRALAGMAPPPPQGSVSLDARPIQRARELLAQHFDAHWGGFGHAPKFPHPTDLTLLLHSADEDDRHMALFTLRKMMEGGIYDQIGGGFARYSVDERWEIPHFEKMLYDNGPLLGLYADAWLLTQDEEFLRVIEETVEWVKREMTAPSGAWYSSLDADSDGEEGKFYVWQREEFDALLGPQESALARRRWGLNEPPNFEDHAWHPRIATPLSDLAEAERPLLITARQKLFAARKQRIHPGRDEKILTSWNALMIEGMAHAARICARPDWLAQAQAAADFLRATHWQGDATPPGRPKAAQANDPEPYSGEHASPPRGRGPGGGGHLLATSKDGRAHLAAYLDDYAFLLAALLELMQAEFRAADLAFAVDLAEALLARFEDPVGGFFFTAHDHEALIQRPKTGHDNATPSGNGIAAHALLKLGHLLGETRYLEAAERCLKLYWPGIQRSPSGFSSLLEALAAHLQPPAIAILRGPASTVALWQQGLPAHPKRLVLALPNGLDGTGLPAALSKPESDHVNAWVCRGVTCLPPIAEFDALLLALSAN